VDFLDRKKSIKQRKKILRDRRCGRGPLSIGLRRLVCIFECMRVVAQKTLDCQTFIEDGFVQMRPQPMSAPYPDVKRSGCSAAAIMLELFFSLLQKRNIF
jgi:hypothetical protein